MVPDRCAPRTRPSPSGRRLLRRLILGSLLPAGLLLALGSSAARAPAWAIPPDLVDADRRLEASRLERERRADELKRAGDAAYAQGQLEQAIVHYDQALAELGDLDLGKRLELDLSRGRARASLGDCEGAMESLQQASGALTGTSAPASRLQGLAAGINALCP